MCIVKKSPRSSLRLFSLPLISVRGVSLKPSFERKQHLMSPPIFFAPFFYQTFFPPLLTKIFFLPHNTSSTTFFNPSQPHIFFLFPFPLSKKLPALSPLLTLSNKSFLSPSIFAKKLLRRFYSPSSSIKTIPSLYFPFPNVKRLHATLVGEFFMANVAQLVRASDCGSEGRGFEPRRSPFFIFLKRLLRFFCFSCYNKLYMRVGITTLIHKLLSPFKRYSLKITVRVLREEP